MRRQTNQRRAIMSTLEHAPGPLTPQEILQEAGKIQASLGLATVYRNLSSMVESGDLIEVHLPNESTRYEPAGRGHHHHFRCESCRGVFELDASCPVAVLEGVTLPGGYMVHRHDLTLYGLCPSCSN
ncbi:MAG: transcriptional repressor [Deinococcota bacterium]|jgi:Fur family ferric uptake transcriptional regulator|nr:transcriptional repressor [Deinococcota bacterium]